MKINHKIIKLSLLVILFISLSLNMFAQIHDVQNDDENRNKPEREEWLRDLGFGMFIHWSVDSQLGVVISHSMVGASNDYNNRFINELPKTFEPSEFDAYRIAKQAKLAGMKYIVFTAKHHSGFCMWDTQTTDFSITNTPYQKDLLKEYVEGVRKAGLAVGLYYSPEDFKFLFDNDITVRRVNADNYIDEKARKTYDKLIVDQTKELFSNYGKIDVLFIDGKYKEICRDVAWDLQPDLVITRGAISSPEQSLPGVASEKLWESCVTMGTQWQYKPTNDDMKSATRIIEMLVESRAKGGNLLLNIGLDPLGEIPYNEQNNLVELSAWHFVNQEAITNVRPWIIHREGNIWYTASKDQKTVYAIITGHPDWQRGVRKTFKLGSVEVTPSTKISVLGQSGELAEYKPDVDAASTFEQQKDGLDISIVRAQRIYNNHKWPNPIVVKLENVKPALAPPVVLTKDAIAKGNEIEFTGEVYDKGDGKKLKYGFEYRPYGGFVENIYNKEWQETDYNEKTNDKKFAIKVNNLKQNTLYEYRAVIVHPRLRTYGEIKNVKISE